jgi:hypothetical protein
MEKGAMPPTPLTLAFFENGRFDVRMYATELEVGDTPLVYAIIRSDFDI